MMTMSYTLVVILVLGVIVGLILAGGGRTIVRQLDPDQRNIYLEQQRSLLPIKIVGGNVTRLLGIVFAVAITAGIIHAGRTGLRYLERQSRATYARDGLYPVIEIAPGAYYDPNRDNPGAHPIITVAALSVQKTAALANAQANFNIKMDTALPTNLPDALPAPHTIELPSRVPLRSLLDGPPSIHRLILGVAINERGEREIITGDMEQMVHVAVGGSSGWGKSIFLRGIGWQAINALEQPDMAMIDLEGVTLSPFAQSEHLRWPVADSMQSAHTVMNGIVEEIEQRKTLFSAYPGVDSLTRYNQQAAERLAPFILLIDEATALLADKSIEATLREVALRARKYGVWAILAGQDWKSSSLDTAIRNQLGSRFQFRAMSASQARVLMENPGAETFDVRGRMQAWLPGRPLIEMQAPFVSVEMLATSAPQTPPEIVDDNALPDDERVRMLHSQGLSNRKIEQRVRGYNGGAATAFVSQILKA